MAASLSRPAGAPSSLPRAPAGPGPVPTRPRGSTAKPRGYEPFATLGRFFAGSASASSAEPEESTVRMMSSA